MKPARLALPHLMLYELKSDLRGIETSLTTPRFSIGGALKSDLRGIETQEARKENPPRPGLKSDLRGIEAYSTFMITNDLA